MSICIIFEHAPHGSAHGREGLDYLLAMASFYDDVTAVFIGDGIYQLLKDQTPVNVLSRNHSKTFKLMDMYGIEKVYVSDKDLVERKLTVEDLIVDVKTVNDELLRDVLSSSNSKVVF